MTGLFDALVDRLRKLPGYAYFLMLVIIVYGRLAGGSTEQVSWFTFAIAVGAWFLYRLSSLVDRAYDWAYKPTDRPRKLWGAGTLQAARDRAALALFQPVDPTVDSYWAAVERRYIARDKARDVPSLFKRAADVAKQTGTWEERIAPPNDLSKAARALFLLVVLLLILERAHVGFLDVRGEVASLIPFGATTLVLVLCALLLFIFYWTARLYHHLRLYDFVSSNVLHFPRPDGTTALLAFDVAVKPSALNGAGVSAE